MAKFRFVSCSPRYTILLPPSVNAWHDIPSSLFSPFELSCWKISHRRDSHWFLSHVLTFILRTGLSSGRVWLWLSLSMSNRNVRTYFPMMVQLLSICVVIWFVYYYKLTANSANSFFVGPGEMSIFSTCVWRMCEVV